MHHVINSLPVGGSGVEAAPTADGEGRRWGAERERDEEHAQHEHCWLLEGTRREQTTVGEQERRTGGKEAMKMHGKRVSLAKWDERVAPCVAALVCHRTPLVYVWLRRRGAG